MLSAATLLASRAILGLAFGYAALTKFREPYRLVDTIAALVHVRFLARILTGLVLLAETSAALFAIAGGGALQASGAVSLGLCGSFATVSALAIIRRLDLDCACFGRRPGSLGARSLVRAILLSGPALVLLLDPRTPRWNLEATLLAALVGVAAVGLAVLILRATDVFFASNANRHWKEVVG